MCILHILHATSSPWRLATCSNDSLQLKRQGLEFQPSYNEKAWLGFLYKFRGKSCSDSLIRLYWNIVESQYSCFHDASKLIDELHILQCSPHLFSYLNDGFILQSCVSTVLNFINDMCQYSKNGGPMSNTFISELLVHFACPAATVKLYFSNTQLFIWNYFTLKRLYFVCN